MCLARLQTVPSSRSTLCGNLPSACSDLLDLRYYNSSQNVLAVTPLPKTTSARGTNSQYSHYDIFSLGNGIYFLKVVNHSPTSLTYHIYEDWEDRKVQFATGDPSYTIGQPASADHAIAVGAYFSKNSGRRMTATHITSIAATMSIWEISLHFQVEDRELMV